MIRKLSITFSLLLVTLGFLWPFLAPSKAAADRASWFFLAALPIAITLIILIIGKERVGSKDIAFLGVLTALVAALRPLGMGAIGIEPMWFALILSARVMGPTFGLLLGAMSMFLSALLTGGVGPWLSYQIAAAALIGFGIGIIPSQVRGRLEILLLAIYGAISAEFFGIAMDLQFWPWALGTGTQLSYQPGGAIVENVSTFFQYHFISALAWDLPRAIITVSLIGVAGPAALNALRRARTKAAFVTQIEFAELADSRFNHR